MLLSIVMLIGGVALILLGANLLTDGASSIASKMGVSDLIIGLTIVALGTSAPEIVVSLMAALSGSAPLAIGNVVGSNIFNVLVIIGITAMVRPIIVERSVLSVEIPVVILSSVVLFVLGNTALLDGFQENIITRSSGIFLLVVFLLYMRHMFYSAMAAPNDSSDSSSVKQMPALKAVAWIILGLGGLVLGGRWFVNGACDIASAMGVSDAVIGLTIVAAGTSLPELATSIVAATKNKPGIAIGNVIGSNIFNVFLVLGISATITPLPFGDINILDLLVLLASTLLFWIFGWFIKVRTITRGEGAFLFLVYVGYIAYLLLTI